MTEGRAVRDKSPGIGFCMSWFIGTEKHSVQKLIPCRENVADCDAERNFMKILPIVRSQMEENSGGNTAAGAMLS